MVHFAQSVFTKIEYVFDSGSLTTVLDSYSYHVPHNIHQQVTSIIAGNIARNVKTIVGEDFGGEELNQALEIPARA